MKHYRIKVVILAIVSIFLIYAACMFYQTKGDLSLLPWLHLDAVGNGIVLIIAIGLVSTALYFYISKITLKSNQSPRLESELGAYEIIADEIKKSSNNLVKSTIDEVELARKNHQITIDTNRLPSAPSKDDHVRLSSGTDVYSPFVDCVIDNIDIKNQKSTLKYYYLNVSYPYLCSAER